MRPNPAKTPTWNRRFLLSPFVWFPTRNAEKPPRQPKKSASWTARRGTDVATFCETLKSQSAKPQRGFLHTTVSRDSCGGKRRGSWFTSCLFSEVLRLERRAISTRILYTSSPHRLPAVAPWRPGREASVARTKAPPLLLLPPPLASKRPSLGSSPRLLHGRGTWRSTSPCASSSSPSARGPAMPRKTRRDCAARSEPSLSALWERQPPGTSQPR